MGLNNTPKGERVHIAIFGRRNVGKSSLINAITNQNLAIVSEVKGTTTDPVYKSMELLPLGPVVVIDTPGLDDEGELGRKRVEKTAQVLKKTDIALIVIDNTLGFSEFEEKLMQETEERKIPCLLVLNKIDLHSCGVESVSKINRQQEGVEVIRVSAASGEGIQDLKKALAALAPAADQVKIAGDLLEPCDFVVLVTPIDASAPKGRLILPQQQTIRDILDSDAIAVVVKNTEYKDVLQNLGKRPKLVITDSQVFAQVSKETPEDIPLTSFSILFARYKGDLEVLIKGVDQIEKLKDGDVVLIAEGCTHHRQCDDIGTVKIPRMLLQHTGKKLQFEHSSGMEFPTDLSNYALVVHCGGCMLNRKEMCWRIQSSGNQKVQIVNYGVLIAYIQGILERSVKPFQ